MSLYDGNIGCADGSADDRLISMGNNGETYFDDESVDERRLSIDDTDGDEDIDEDVDCKGESVGEQQVSVRTNTKDDGVDDETRWDDEARDKHSVSIDNNGDDWSLNKQLLSTGDKQSDTDNDGKYVDGETCCKGGSVNEREVSIANKDNGTLDKTGHGGESTNDWLLSICNKTDVVVDTNDVDDTEEIVGDGNLDA